MLRNIELFLRGETYLHLATMFLTMVILIQVSNALNFEVPIWVLILFMFIVAFVWELGWKIAKQKPINFWDISGGIIGGSLAIILLKFI